MVIRPPLILVHAAFLNLATAILVNFISCCIDGFQCPTFIGQTRDQEAAVQWTFCLQRNSFIYLSRLMVKIRYNITSLPVFCTQLHQTHTSTLALRKCPMKTIYKPVRLIYIHVDLQKLGILAKQSPSLKHWSGYTHTLSLFHRECGPSPPEHEPNFWRSMNYIIIIMAECPHKKSPMTIHNNGYIVMNSCNTEDNFTHSSSSF